MTSPQDLVLRWLERAALLVLVLYFCAFTLPRAWRTLNTDFPNYYMCARLAHEGLDTARINEWVWLQREKDHRALDIKLIGFIPITPFSTLAMWPITSLAPLAAKHVWLLVNLALLIPLCWMLRSMTGLTYQRIALVLALSYPLHRNLLFGQYYLFLLVLIVAACWAYLRELYVLAGALVAIAAACKIFPVLFLVFFLQRRAWRALLSCITTGLATIGASIAVFGWGLHRTYLHEVLPWTLHGEGMPPYVISAASISSVLHYLFLAEPEWNPHPWHSSPLTFALLQPTLQMLALAPAILLIRREDRTPTRILLEWSALLVASLAISTMPASYHFVLMVFPVCVVGMVLLQRRQYGWLVILLIAYLGMGFVMPSPNRYLGPAILFYVPRLFLLLALLLGHYALLWRGRPRRDWTHYAWATAMAVAVIVNVPSILHLQRAVRQEYAYRLPMQTQALLHAQPQSVNAQLRYITMTGSGYHLVPVDQAPITIQAVADDDLSFTHAAEDIWVERAASPFSNIVALRAPKNIVVHDARNPMLSADGQDLAFIRDDHGRGRLEVQKAFPTATATEAALTPSSLNVYEASFRSKNEYAFSAVENGQPPRIYITDATHSNAALPLGESRYPALSPDGLWMAYSHLDHGAWNLWLRDQRSGATRRIADLPCNQIEPSWEDSKTLLYSTDCGRSLWLTAISQRRVLN